MASFSDPPVYTSPRWTARDLVRRVPAPHVLGLAAAAPLAGLTFAYLGAGARAAIGAFFVAVLAVLSAVDIAERRLPNRIVLPSAAAVLVAQTALFPDRSLEWMLAAAGAALGLFVAYLAWPGALGMGDVKLGLLLGATLGSAVVTALLLGVLAAALYALALLARHGLGARHRTIPLGPFLAFGGIAALLL